MELELNVKTRETKNNNISIEELLSKRESEFKNYKTEEYPLLPSEIDIDLEIKKKYNDLNEYLNADIFDTFEKEKDIKYFLEVEGKNFTTERIEIKLGFILECLPPILNFENLTEDLSLTYPNLTECVTLNVVACGKEFKFKFDEVKEFVSESKYDERFDKYKDMLLKEHNIHCERNFYKFTIRDNLYKNMYKDDIYRNLIFAIHDNKMIFRRGKFRMINDELYDLVNKNNLI